MHIILIHGLPGVGKLTVAKELAKKTGYKLFHNHLTIDLVSSLFTLSYPRYWDLNRELRLLMIEEAAKADLKGIIITYCYAPSIGDQFITSLLSLVKKYTCTLDVVYLRCTDEALYQRVESPSRQGTTKLHTKKELIKALEALPFTQIPQVESLVIDNTMLPPEQVAEMISDSCMIG